MSRDDDANAVHLRRLGGRFHSCATAARNPRPGGLSSASARRRGPRSSRSRTPRRGRVEGARARDRAGEQARPLHATVADAAHAGGRPAAAGDALPARWTTASKPSIAAGSSRPAAGSQRISWAPAVGRRTSRTTSHPATPQAAVNAEPMRSARAAHQDPQRRHREGVRRSGRSPLHGGHERLEEVHGHREDRGRVVLGRDLGERLKVAQAGAPPVRVPAPPRLRPAASKPGTRPRR